MLYVIEAKPLGPYLREGMVGSCGDVVTDPADALKFSTAPDAAIQAEWLVKGTRPWTSRGVRHYDLAPKLLCPDSLQFEATPPRPIHPTTGSEQEAPTTTASNGSLAT